MLKNTFFYIKSISEISEGKFSAQIRLNPVHKIYKGHFPGNPVTPGVASVQIISEILEEYLQKKLQLLRAGNIKFTVVIKPDLNPDLIVDIQHKTIDLNKEKVNAVIKFEETVFLKFNGVYKISE